MLMYVYYIYLNPLPFLLVLVVPFTQQKKKTYTHTHISTSDDSHIKSQSLSPFLVVCVSFGKPTTHIHIMCILYYQISIFFLLLLLACFIIPIYVRTYSQIGTHSTSIVIRLSPQQQQGADPGMATPDSRFTHETVYGSFSKKVCETGIWRRHSSNREGVFCSYHMYGA